MDILMPQMGETVAEGTVNTWHKKVGDQIKVGDVLFEIETDKASLEIEATEAGTLSAIHVKEGETAPVGAVVAVIGDGSAKPAAAAEAPAPVSASSGANGSGGDEVRMPQLGETVTEGTISVWHKQVGDQVRIGDPLFEIETDKTSMEIEATSAGILTDILVKEGETVAVQTVVAVIGGTGTRTSAPAPAPAAKIEAAPASAAPAAAPAQTAAFQPAEMDPFMEVRTPVRNYGKATSNGMKITPLARRMIAEQGLDLSAIAAQARTRGADRVSRADVLAAAGSRPAAPAPSSLPAIEAGPGDKVVELSRIRRITAERLAESWRTAPHVFQTVEVDFTRVSEVRNSHKGRFKERHGVSLTYLPFIIRASAIALGEFPNVNAHYQDGRLIARRDVNIGIAVDLDHQGLVVPVIFNADGFNVPGLARELDRLVKKARDGKLTPGDFQGGTYSISNNGSFGTLFTAAIINIPQVAILSSDAIRKRPVAIDTPDGEALAIRPVGVLGQSFDHRAFDGGYSASFLARVKDILENRNWSGEFD